MVTKLHYSGKKTILKASQEHESTKQALVTTLQAKTTFITAFESEGNNKLKPMVMRPIPTPKPTNNIGQYWFFFLFF